MALRDELSSTSTLPPYKAHSTIEFVFGVTNAVLDYGEEKNDEQLVEICRPGGA
jgi:hypothetical protein